MKAVKGQQGGAVLVMSLIFLMVMTMFTLTKSKLTHIDEKVTSNHKLQAEVFQIADAGLEQAKSVIINSTDFSAPINGGGSFAGGSFAYTISQIGKQPVVGNGNMLQVIATGTKATASRTLVVVIGKPGPIVFLDGVVAAY